MTDQGVVVGGGLREFSVVDVTDVLLLSLARRQSLAVTIAPDGDLHAICSERSGASTVMARIDSPYGDALVARIALLAGLDLLASHEQLGRVCVEEDSAPGSIANLLVVVRQTPNGLSAELRRIAAHQDEVAAGDPSRAGDGESARLGSYRLLGEIGRGGMGVVYRAEHVLLQKVVALKAIHSWMASDAESAERLVLEARAACRTRHTGIVDVTDVGRLPDGRAFLVMEFIDAPTLEVLLHDGPLDLLRAMRLATAIAEALCAAHGSGVVHRDLKPANVFVLPADAVKIGDFGVAKVLDGARRAEPGGREGVVGTPWYMSPEQARGDAADARSDLYSLGCVLFEMISGRPPFDGSTAGEVLDQHIQSPVPPLVGPEGRVPDAVEAVVRRVMAKPPEARHQSAEELRSELVRTSRALQRAGWRRWLPR